MKWFLNLVWSLKPINFKNRIIYYHSVLDSGEISHNLVHFEKQLDWLIENNFHFIKVSEIDKFKYINNERPWVVITFDDGYKDNVETVIPLLLKKGIVATFFIVTDWLDLEKFPDGNRKYPNVENLNKEDVLYIHNSGMEVGSHTKTHRLCTEIIQEGKSELEKEIRLSKKVLEKIIGDKVTTFAYPNGQKGAFSGETKNILEQADFKIACTTIWGSVDKKSDLLELPRCEIAHTDTLTNFIKKMEGKRDYLSIIHKSFNKSNVWRNKK